MECISADGISGIIPGKYRFGAFDTTKNRLNGMDKKKKKKNEKMKENSISLDCDWHHDHISIIRVISCTH